MKQYSGGKMKNIFDLTVEDLEEYFINKGSKKFHALQLFNFLYEKRIKNIEEVTTIKKELLEEIKKDFSFDEIKLVLVEKDKDVSKYLFELRLLLCPVLYQMWFQEFDLLKFAEFFVYTFQKQPVLLSFDLCLNPVYLMIKKHFEH